MRTIALVVALLVTLAAGRADAQELTAREHFARGTTAFQQGDNDAAIAEWNAAYAADPRPLLQYNLSQAFERAGRLPEAITALDTYLAHAESNDPNQADARARIVSLRERISHTAVRIIGGPESATILIDGEDKGRTPRPDPITVAPGSHRIVIRQTGYADFNATVVVPGGQSIDITVEMTPTPNGTSALVTPPSGSGGSGGPNLLPPGLLLGGGGLTAVVGFILGGVALGNAGSAMSSTDATANSARGLALGADVCIWGGLAIAVAGGVWLALEISAHHDEHAASAAGPRLAVAPFVGPHEAGASALVAF